MAMRRRSKGAAMLYRMGPGDPDNPARVHYVARLVGCNPSLVVRWRSGERVPDMHWRRVLWQLFSIHPGLWDIPLNSNRSPERSVRELVAAALARWPEARARAVRVLERQGIP